MNAMAVNAVLGWLTWILDHHLPSVACAVAIIVFVVLDLRSHEE